MPENGWLDFIVAGEAHLRHKGKIIEWRDDQGFGFIAPARGGDRVFLHINAFARRGRRPAQGDLVIYQLSFDERRRPRASSARFSMESVPESGRRRSSVVPLAIAMAFVIVLAATVRAGKVPPEVLWLYLAASVVAFLAYLLDKAAARSGRWRTQESTLHFFALVGGWPGALIAQRFFRHKSSKIEFQRVFWATVVVNCLVLGWFLKHGDAGEMLRSLVGAR